MEGRRRRRSGSRFDANEIEGKSYPSCLYSLGEILDSVGRSLPLVGMRVEEMRIREREALQIQMSAERVKLDELDEAPSGWSRPEVRRYSRRRRGRRFKARLEAWGREMEERSERLEAEERRKQEVLAVTPRNKLPRYFP